MTHQRRASPLHAARAGVGAVWCLMLVAVALSFEHPLLLATLLAVTLAAAAAAHVGRAVARSLRWAAPFALAIVAVNAIVTRDGVTVLFRGGDGARRSGGSTSPPRRSPTARCSACARS